MDWLSGLSHSFIVQVPNYNQYKLFINGQIYSAFSASLYGDSVMRRGRLTVLTCFLVDACDVVWVRYFRNTSEASWITSERVGVAWRQNQQQDVRSRGK